MPKNVMKVSLHQDIPITYLHFHTSTSTNHLGNCQTEYCQMDGISTLLVDAQVALRANERNKISNKIHEV